MLKYKAFGKEHNIYLETTKYSENGNIAVRMLCDDEGFLEPWSMLTVNICKLSDNLACIDVNNNSYGEDICEWIVRNNIGTPTIVKKSSGFCTYPVFRFNMDEVRKHRYNGA